MLLFGHIGITAGVVKVYDILVPVTKIGKGSQSNSNSEFGMVIGKKQPCPYYLFNGIKSRIGSIDYRLVLLGSLLPDIIDKAVWFFASGDAFLSGRDYSHTLLFSLALFIGGLVLIRYSKSWLFIISLSSFMHLILDQMWNSPAVLLWPLFGSLPKRETAGWLYNIFRALFSSPEVYVPEIIGLVIVLLFAYRLMVSKGIISFLKHGTVG